ncbi:MAG: hypothetical protein Q4G35_14370 [Propionibacteriaceae bacterium]|nr:hypothetical protein [Propionibacteriaceae bacterium]
MRDGDGGHVQLAARRIGIAAAHRDGLISVYLAEDVEKRPGSLGRERDRHGRGRQHGRQRQNRRGADEEGSGTAMHERQPYRWIVFALREHRRKPADHR